MNDNKYSLATYMLTESFSSGEPGFVMVKYIDIPEEFFTLDSMIRRLEATKEHNNIEKIKSWHFEFRWIPHETGLKTPTCSCSIFRMLNSLWFSTPGNTLTSSKKRMRPLKFWSETTVSSERSSPSFYSAQRERVTRWSHFKNCNFNTTALISKLGATLSSFEFNWYRACSKLHFCTSCLLL